MTEYDISTNDHVNDIVREARFARSAKDLEVYKKAYALALDIFEMTKRFPPEEKFSLTSQLRRSSRSVCGNLREAWAKRRYEAHFISKLTDVDGENSETETWLDFAMNHKYITQDTHAAFAEKNREIGRMVGSMLKNPHPFLLTPDT